jgi:NTP pyrophosphatase (non-canonical NTP hydrolase)
MEFEKFSRVNWARCVSPQGFNEPSPDPMYLLTGITEELGEICGIIKKLQRGFNKREQKKTLKKFIQQWENDIPGHRPPSHEIDPIVLEGFWYKSLKAKLGPEVADVFGYLDLFAQRMNINIPIALMNKFNEVNGDMECTQYNIDIHAERVEDFTKQADIRDIPPIAENF